jgi:hypothetical protein
MLLSVWRFSLPGMGIGGLFDEISGLSLASI